MAAGKIAKPSEEALARDRLADTHTRYEFGGPVGVSCMMVGFPLMMCESPASLSLARLPRLG